MTYQHGPIKVVVLVSGVGSLMQSIISEQDDHYVVVGVVSDVDCPAVAKAQAAGIRTNVVALNPGDDREEWNQTLTEKVQAMAPDIVVSAGFMRILGPTFLQAFPGRILNTHPALLPSFPGGHAVRDTLDYGVAITGTTVHVVDEGVDTGPIIAQAAVPVLADDNEASLHERIKVEERRLIVDVLKSENPTAPHRKAHQ